MLQKYVAFRVLDLPQDYLENSPSSQLISTALAAIAEFETARRHERQQQLRRKIYIKAGKLLSQRILLKLLKSTKT